MTVFEVLSWQWSSQWIGLWSKHLPGPGFLRAMRIHTQGTWFTVFWAPVISHGEGWVEVGHSIPLWPPRPKWGQGEVLCKFLWGRLRPSHELQEVFVDLKEGLSGSFVLRPFLFFYLQILVSDFWGEVRLWYVSFDQRPLKFILSQFLPMFCPGTSYGVYSPLCVWEELRTLGTTVLAWRSSPLRNHPWCPLTALVCWGDCPGAACASRATGNLDFPVISSDF